jgi:glycosyltransferase involved in cell wall biosynthesis
VKIAFDHQIFAMQDHGGISRYICRLAGELSDMGHAVRIVAPLHVNAYLPALPPGLVTGHRLAPSRGARRLTRAVDAVLAPPLLGAFGADIVIETYYAARRTSWGKARVVVPVHDMIHELYPEDFPANDPVAARKAAAVERADHIICVSENTRADLLRFHPQVAGKTSVVLHGFDVPATLPPGTPPARPCLLFVGLRGGYKNWDGLLAAYAASPALRAGFDLVAVGGGAFTAAESAAIAADGLGALVRQRGASDLELQRLYADAAAFIYPSLYEGFGIPPLEAMAAGTPVVTMAASAMPEVCGDAAAYAMPGDADSLRTTIESVVLDPARTAALVAAGTARLQRFSWRRCAEETAAVLTRLVG